MIKEAKSEELKSGLTWRSLLAVITSALIFIPISTYASLVLGSGMGAVAVYFITLLVSQLALLSGRPLSPNELLMVYYGAGVGGASGLASAYGLIIYRVYFVQSPFAWSYTIDGIPLAKLVPSWLAPPLTSETYELRTLFHPDFVPPLLAWLSMGVLTFIAEIALAMFLSQVYVEYEKLPFPFADLDTSIITVLTQRGGREYSIFITTMIIGILWSLILYVPFILMGFMLIPIPFYDLTWLIQNYLPGMPLLIPTSIGVYFSGLLVPFESASYIFAVSLIMSVLTSLFITTFPNVFPEWPQEYIKGMGYTAIQWRAGIRVWFVPQIGFGFAAAIYMMFKARGAILRLFKRAAMMAIGRKRERSALGFPNPLVLLLMFLGATLTSVALFHFLVPEVPLWVPLFASVIYSFFIGIALTAMQGTVGYTVAPQWVWHTLVYLTPYKGYAGFVYPPVMAGTMAPGFSQQVVVALRTKTKPTDLVKLAVISMILVNVIGLLSINVFWQIAPIPSAAYPATVYNYPATAVTDAFLVTRQLRVNPQYLLGSMLFALTGASLLDGLSRLIGFTFSPVGYFMGLFNWIISGPLAMFIASAISKFVMPRVFGSRDEWRRIRGAFVAGEQIGEGLIMTILLSINLISKASWLWPW